MWASLHRRKRTSLRSGSMLVAALVVAGCETTQMPETVGSIGPSAAAEGEHDGRHAVEAAGAIYKAHPDDPQAAISYARALRGIGERTQSSAVLEQASIRQPEDRDLLGAY